MPHRLRARATKYCASSISRGIGCPRCARPIRIIVLILLRAQRTFVKLMNIIEDTLTLEYMGLNYHDFNLVKEHARGCAAA